MYESVRKRRCRSNVGIGPCVAMAESDAKTCAETGFCWSIRTDLFVGSSREEAQSRHVTESPKHACFQSHRWEEHRLYFKHEIPIHSSNDIFPVSLHCPDPTLEDLGSRDIMWNTLM